MKRCRWCDKKLESAGQGTPRQFCNDKCRHRFKRAERAEGTAEIVKRLEPYVRPEGALIFEELITHLGTRLQESASAPQGATK